MNKYSEWIAAGMTLVALVALALLAQVSLDNWKNESAVESMTADMMDLRLRVDILEVAMGSYVSATASDLMGRHVGTEEDMSALRERLKAASGESAGR